MLEGGAFYLDRLPQEKHLEGSLGYLIGSSTENDPAEVERPELGGTCAFPLQCVCFAFEALTIKAEDYRMLADMGHLKKVISGLQQTNQD
eukprot:1659592-Amphidinium_carterae.1